MILLKKLNAKPKYKWLTYLRIFGDNECKYLIFSNIYIQKNPAT